MARETHVPPSSGLPGRLPGLGHGRTLELHGDPTIGAADAAPTAPHATPPEDGSKPSGPVRFWKSRRVRAVFVAMLVFSSALHSLLSPWQLLPDMSGIEVKDPEGELSIPVDFLGAEQPPEETPKPPEEKSATPNDPNSLDALKDAGPKPKDAAADVEAHGKDASATSLLPDGGPANGDGGGPTDAGEGDGGDGGLVALSDAGPGAGGPTSPASMVGVRTTLNTGPQNVVLLVNVATIRKNSVGARLGPILQAIPQWRDFMQGSQVPIDPIRDTEWILIYGPSLIHTDRDAVLVRYTASDEIVDQVLRTMETRSTRGGAFDAGVPGVKASLGFADNAERVFMRPQPKLLVIVPPKHAREAAVAYKKETPRGPVPAEAMRLVVRNPSGQVAIRGLKFSNSLKEIRLWIIPDAQGGADVYGSGDCENEASAIAIADELTDAIRQQNQQSYGFGPLRIRVSTVLHGLLDNARVTPDGTQVKTHIHANADQLEAVLGIVAAATGANVAPPPGRQE